MTPDGLDLVPPDPAEAALRVRDHAHSTGRDLLVRRSGEILVLSPAGAPRDDALAVALHILAPAIRRLLEPWTCPWCDAAAELPDGCTQCHLAIRHYTRGGAHFALGRTVSHALRDWTHTSCGLDVADMPSIPLTLVEPGKLCRRCLVVLIREHRDSGENPQKNPRRPRG